MQETDQNIVSDFTNAVRTIADFPKPGIAFKDITPLFTQPALCFRVTGALKSLISALKVDAVAGIESRGYFFGFALAQALGIPFIMIRKAGKLPGVVTRIDYALEYGTAAIEVQEGLITPGMKVMVHDDLLATGGTAVAAGELVQKAGGEVSGFVFLIELTSLKGRDRISALSENIFTLAQYS